MTNHRIICREDLPSGDVVTITERVEDLPTFGNPDFRQTEITWRVIHEHDGEQDIVQECTSMSFPWTAIRAAFLACVERLDEAGE